MNRRSFLKFAGLAPVVPALAGKLLAESTQVNTTGRPMFRALESGKRGDVIACEMWDNDQSDPISDIIKACKAIKSHTGKFPPTYAISKENYERLGK